ncbi:uncharacterized protein [Nicotiana tomentosiformis]|uniref:uncharacterized protein n=1 Tax=Nicotiana tomentosiformis TaxID=4098 RepID=UPI00388CB3A5
MADNTVNNMHNPEIRGDQPHFEDSISDTRNEENDATLVHDRQNPRQVRETTSDDADEEHVVDAFMREVNARMDQISGVPLILKGLDSKKYTQLPHKSSATPELIPKRFKMLEMPKYDGTSNPQEHITTYTTAVKGNDLAPHKIESVMLKTFGETLTRGALTWYSLLPEHSIDYFEMLTDSFIKAHAGARKVQSRKADIFRIAQGESKLLREFITRFQKERMLLPVVPDKWAAEAFTKGLNPRSSDASRKMKESLLEFQATTWADIHNWYESKIRIEDDQVSSTSSAKGREKSRE